MREHLLQPGALRSIAVLALLWDCEIGGVNFTVERKA